LVAFDLPDDCSSFNFNYTSADSSCRANPAGGPGRHTRCAAPAFGTFRDGGEVPMRRTLRPLGLVAVLLAATPVLAGNPELSDKDKLDRILLEVQNVKKELEDVRTLAVQVQNTAKEVRELQRRMENLEASIDKLSASRMRVAASYTPNDSAAAASINLQNRSGTAATVYVNGQPYPVPAYATRRIAGVPAGAFTYAVQAEGFGEIQPPANRTVGPNEVFTVFINPPAPQLLLEP
jgi:hypothetical protein